MNDNKIENDVLAYHKMTGEIEERRMALQIDLAKFQAAQAFEIAKFEAQQGLEVAKFMFKELKELIPVVITMIEISDRPSKMSEYDRVKFEQAATQAANEERRREEAHQIEMTRLNLQNKEKEAELTKRQKAANVS